MTAREAPPTFAAIVRQGTLAAGILAALAGEAIVLVLLGGLPQDVACVALNLGAAAGAGLALAACWRWIVPRGESFGLLRTVIAGCAAAVVTHAVVWLGFFWASVLASHDSFPDVARALGFTASLVVVSLLLAGLVTVPAAVTVALAVTFWCRHRLAQVGYPRQ
jgi:hypothetical protein